MFTPTERYLCGVTWFRKNRWILLVLVLSAGLRLIVGVDRDRWPLTSDEAGWERQGQIYATHGLGVEDVATYRSPLYPFLIGATYALLGTETIHIRSLQIGLSVLVVLAAYTLSLRFADARVPILAACVAAFYPLWALVNVLLLAETTLVCLTMGACLQALRTIENPTLTRCLALGLLLGGGVLCGPVLILWTPFAAGAVIWFTSGGFAQRINRLVAITCGFLVVVIPWTVRNEVVTGYRLFLPKDTGMRLLIGHEPRAEGTRRARTNYVAMYERLGVEAPDPVQKDREVLSEVVGWMADSPGRTLMLGVRKVWVLWSSVLQNAPRRTTVLHFLAGVAVTGFGFIGLFRHRRDPIGSLVWSVVVVWTMACGIFYASPEFRLPVDLCLIPFASVAALRAFDRVRDIVIKRFRELEAA